MTFAEQLRIDADEIAGWGAGNEVARVRHAAALIESQAATIAKMRTAALDRKKTIAGLKRQVDELREGGRR